MVLLVALASPTSASEESEALSARAMVALQRGNDKEAIDLFDRAVAADPEDALATFHRGVALSKQGQPAKAIADFESTLALRPDLDEAALELGITLVESGRPEDAGPWLEQARRRPELAGQADFFLGIAALRAERYDEARASLERARAADPALATSARYYLGVIDYRSGNRLAARDHFTDVMQQSPESAVGREAAAFLEILRAEQGTGSRIYGGASLQYDSNVVLAPARGLPDPSISGKSDGRATINAGGIYEAWRGETTQVSVGYDFYQDLQFELTEFNVQNHRPSLLVSTDFGPVRGVFLANYDFYILDTTRWLQSATAMPMLILPQGDIGRLEAYVRFQWRDYLQSRFDILNGFNTAGGVRQVLTLGAPGRLLWGSLEVDSQDSDVSGGELYEYNGVQGEVSLRWPLPWTTAGQLGYRFRREDYNDASTVFVPVGRSRLDYEHRIGAALRRPLTDMISLVAAWVGTWNESNKDDFEYDRHIVSLGVELRY
jgi:Tfp pilus assembly protein PilF